MKKHLRASAPRHPCGGDESNEILCENFCPAHSARVFLKLTRELPCGSKRSSMHTRFAPRAKPVPVSRTLLHPLQPPRPPHRAVVPAQLLLVPEVQVQPVARHIQVLRAEAGAAAEAPRGGRRHGKAALQASLTVLPGASPLRAWRRQPRGRCKFLTAEKNEEWAGPRLRGRTSRVGGDGPSTG